MSVDSARRNLISLLVISAIHGVNHTFSIFLSPLNEEIRIFFGAHSIAAITAFKSTYLFVYAISNLAAGFMVHRVSARRVISIGMAVNGIAVACFALVSTDGLGMMHLLWALAALGGGVYHPLGMALVTNTYRERKGWALGITGIGAGLGFSFSPVISSLLANSFGMGWQQIAVIFGVAGVVFALLAYLALVDPPKEIAEEFESPEEPESAAVRDGPQRKRTVAWSLLVAIIVIAGTREIAIWSVLDASDFFLLRAFGRTAPTGFFLFLLYIPAVVVQPVVGHLSDRGNRGIASALALGLYGLTVAALTITPPRLMWVAYLVMGTMMAATLPTLDAMVADVAPHRGRGIAFGVLITFGIGIGSVGPLLFGLVVDAFGGRLVGFHVSFWSLAALALAGAIMMAIIGRRRLPTP